jgi:ATP-dependent DNA ligase
MALSVMIEPALRVSFAAVHESGPGPKAKKLNVCYCSTSDGRADMSDARRQRSVQKPPTGSGWVHEVKHDGYRLQIRPRRAGCGSTR